MTHYFQVVAAHLRGKHPPFAFQVEFPADAVTWAFVPRKIEDILANEYLNLIAAKTGRPPQQVVDSLDIAAFEACAEIAVRKVMESHYLDFTEWWIFPALRLRPSHLGADGTYTCDEFVMNIKVAWDVNLAQMEEFQYVDE